VVGLLVLGVAFGFHRSISRLVFAGVAGASASGEVLTLCVLQRNLLETLVLVQVVQSLYVLAHPFHGVVSVGVCARSFGVNHGCSPMGHGNFR